MHFSPSASSEGPSNLGAYLTRSIVDPVMRVPFSEEHFRCLGAMEAIARHLSNIGAASQSVKVTVVLPVWNRARTLNTSIESVLAQKYANYELIVVDDGSDDDSYQIASAAAAKDARVRVIRCPERSGVSRARNLALEAAKGEIIAYLDSDNIWLPDYLAVSVGAFVSRPDADAIYTGQYVFDQTDLTQLAAIRFAPMNHSLLEQHNYIDLNCFVHRRNVIEKGVRFDETLRRLVDWDLILRINEHFRIVSVPAVLSCYYHNAAENTITKTESLEYPLVRIAERVDRKDRPRTVALEHRVVVVIPSFEALEHLKLCLESLEGYSKQGVVEIVIVDNQSSIQVREYLISVRSEKLKVIFNDENYGFSYAVNQGVAVATPDADIVLLNNDARLTPGSLEALQQLTYSDESIGISIPRQIVPPHASEIPLHVPYADVGRECDVSLSKHHSNVDRVSVFHDGRHVDLNFAPFFCAYIRRSTWDKCGGLDAEHGRHYRSDRIMCDFVKHVLNQRIVYTPFARVYHAVQVSTGELASRSRALGQQSDYRRMLQQNIWPEELAQRLKYSKKPWQT